MPIDFGTVRPGTTLYVPFQTFSSDDPTASMTLTGLATTDIEIYSNGSTTQRGSDNGYALLDTDGIDFDGITGIHGFSIDLADNSTAGFYAAGNQYWVVVSSITVDGATINFIAATFRIGYQDAILNTTIATLSSQTSFTLTAGPAEDDALNGCQIVIHDVASAVQVGRAVILDYTGSTKTVTLAAGTTFTAAATDNVAVLGLAPLMPTTQGRTLDVTSTGEAGVDWANVGSPSTTVNLSGTTVSAVSGAVGSVTGAVGSVTGAVASVTGNVGGNVTGTVGSVVGAVGSVTATVNANVTQISGDSTAADNLEAALDGTGGVAITATFTGDLTGSAASVSGAVGSVTGAVGSVTGNVGGNVTGTVASVVGNVGGNVTGSVGSVASGGITRASFAADTGLVTVRSNTAQAGASTTITLDASASATNDVYNGLIVLLTGGTGAGQARVVTDYVGSTKVATVNDAWATNPSSDTTFALLPLGFAPSSAGLTAADVWAHGSRTLTAADNITSTGGTVTVSGGAVTVGTNNDKTGYALTQAFPSNFSSLGINASGHVSRVTLTDTVTTLTGHTAQTGDAYAVVNSGTHGNAALKTLIDAVDDFIDTEVAAIKAKTDQLTFSTTNKLDATIQAAGDFAQGAADKVWSTAARTLTAATNITSTGGTITVSSGSVSVYSHTTAALAQFFTADSGETYADAVAGSVVAEIADNSGGSALSLEDIADAVWDEARSGHVGAGSFGEGIASVQGNVTGSVASVVGAVGSVTGNVGGNVTGSVGSVVGAVGSVTGNVGGVAGTTTTLDALQTALNSAHGSGSWATATGFSTHSASDVWAVGTRTITGGTIGTYTGNTPQTGDAYAVVNSGTHGNAALKTLIDAVDDLIDTEVAAIKAKTDNLPASPAAVGSAMTLTSGERDAVAAALLDLSAGVETGLTPRQALRLIAAAVAGKLSGAATNTVTIRNAVADSKARITATCDSDGNRSAITWDAT